MGRPKGSKNRPKNHSKHPVNRHKQPVNEPESAQDESTCKICQRVQFGQIQPLGNGLWRHAGCALGSEEWKEYFHRLPVQEAKPLQEYYNSYYKT